MNPNPGDWADWKEPQSSPQEDFKEGLRAGVQYNCIKMQQWRRTTEHLELDQIEVQRSGQLATTLYWWDVNVIKKALMMDIEWFIEDLDRCDHLVKLLEMLR